MDSSAQSVKRPGRPPSIDMRKLRSRRNAANLTVRDLAAQAGISFSLISMIENGHRVNPALGAVVALAKALGCEITDLMPDESTSGTAA